MMRNVYVGGIEFSAGRSESLENEVGGELSALLKSSSYGLSKYAYHEFNISELIVETIKKTLALSKLNSNVIDAVFVISNTLDASNNLDANWLGEINEITGLERATNYHIGMAGCGGFHWAARLAASLIMSNECEHILLVSFDKGIAPLQRVYDDNPNFIYVTGDAAASCVFSSSRENMEYTLLGKILNAYDGKQIVQPTDEKELRIISKLFKDAYSYANIAANKVNYFISNNYNLRVSQLFCQLANVSFSKAYTENIAKYAHCFSADNMINLCTLNASQKPEKESIVLLFSTGPFQWGACVFKKI
jgi:3-oxoacyl-[acyl-carrier-protein] synthase III